MLSSVEQAFVGRDAIRAPLQKAGVGGYYFRGGGLFDLETTIASVLHREFSGLHKEPEHKVAKLKYKRF